ncbi:hypothetical protein AC629_29690 [Bradyrhizobium sp. NAS80.1]|uniref:hypothetical protein n=1 Tax=Bradyrhizobium sp. NAS80.1 TaxID=1680159 RepID=UPI0009674640|nr:hypothetical protein [Bradyrhizobium sp. NAS80.1]OKO78860.1 hypothetical protein AC629_29690 [Bradyrhizobium sp. NAS80.1]
MTARVRLTIEDGDLQTLGTVKASSAFNLAGFEVVAAENGEATMRMTWRGDLTKPLSSNAKRGLA